MTQNTILGNGQFELNSVSSYEEGKIVKTPVYNSDNTKMIVVAFAQGQEMKPHTSPMDAVLQILDGEAVIHLDGKDYTVKTGELIFLPANVPHGLKADKNFRVLITKSAI